MAYPGHIESLEEDVDTRLLLQRVRNRLLGMAGADALDLKPEA